MDKVYARVAMWNSRRYDREYNAELSYNLIKEELQEYVDAKTEVDRLDALCDVIYIALGMHWKSNLSMESLQKTENDALLTTREIIHNAQMSAETPIDLLLDTLIMEQFENEGLIVAYFTNVLVSVCALVARDTLRLSQAQFVEAMLVVCDSNDTKSVKKTKSDVKANKDKGTYFTPPEFRLQLILDKREVLQ